MSKTLSKAMIICAMVIILPLMIVGITYSAYYSIDARVILGVYTNRTNNAEGAYAKVYANGDETAENDTLVDGHLKKVVFNATAEGYDFVGWFEGDEKDYAVAHQTGEVEYFSNESVLKAGMSDYEKLLAIFEIKEYNIAFSYFANPNDSEKTVVAPATYTWGDEIAPLSYNGIDYKFVGWREVGSQTIVNTAKFDSENVVLEAVWEEAGKITVNYYNTKNQIVYSADKVYPTEEYTIKSFEDIAKINPSLSLKSGYKYAWVNGEGLELEETISSTENIDIYLKETAIDYTATINTNGVSYKKGTTVNFTGATAGDLVSLLNFANWTEPYSFYEFTGISYNGKTYLENQSTALWNAIINANPNGLTKSLTLEAVVEKKLTEFSVESKIDGYAIVGAYKIADVYREADIGSIAWSIPKRTISSTSTFAELLYLTNSKLYIGSSSADKQEVKICGVEISIGGKETSFAVTADTVLNDFIQEVIDSNEFEITQDDLFEIATMTVQFEIVK